MKIRDVLCCGRRKNKGADETWETDPNLMADIDTTPIEVQGGPTKREVARLKQKLYLKALYRVSSDHVETGRKPTLVRKKPQQQRHQRKPRDARTVATQSSNEDSLDETREQQNTTALDSLTNCTGLFSEIQGSIADAFQFCAPSSSKTRPAQRSPKSTYPLTTSSPTDGVRLVNLVKATQCANVALADEESLSQGPDGTETFMDEDHTVSEYSYPTLPAYVNTTERSLPPPPLNYGQRHREGTMVGEEDPKISPLDCAREFITKKDSDEVIRFGDTSPVDAPLNISPWDCVQDLVVGAEIEQGNNDTRKPFIQDSLVILGTTASLPADGSTDEVAKILADLAVEDDKQPQSARQ